MKKIAIVGSRGFIGSHLFQHLQGLGFEVVGVGHSQISVQSLNNVDVVINLAGAPLDNRWQRDYHEVVYTSRVNTTRHLVEVLNSLESPVSLLVNASAVGIYPDGVRCDEDTAPLGTDYLSRICQDWEAAANGCSEATRVVCLRLGVVLSPNGGAMAKMLSIYKSLRTEIIMGEGSQKMPWIAIEDLVRVVETVIEDEGYKGAVNAVAPEQTTFKNFADALATQTKSRLKIYLPKSILALTLGSLPSQMLCASKEIVARKLINNKFQWRYPAIANLISQRK